jgi:transposase
MIPPYPRLITNLTQIVNTGSKMHAVCDALGNPLRFILTPGQQHDATVANEILQGLQADALLADKGYDADDIINSFESGGGKAIIPPRRNRLEARKYDHHVHKERHKIECLFGFMNHYRRIFSRFDKYKRHFQAFIHLVPTLQWLK